MACALLIFVFGILAFGIVFIFYYFQKGFEEKETLTFSCNDVPSFIPLMIKGSRHIFRKQGKIYTVDEASSANVSDSTATPISGKVFRFENKVVLENFKIDEDNVVAYKQLCCPKYSEDMIPICYLETLFLKHLTILSTSSRFPLCPLGLIHIRQTITQYQNLDSLLSEDLHLEARVLQYTVVERGVEGEVKFSVTDSSNVLVWEGTLTVLSRNPQAVKSGASKHKERRNNTEKIEDADILGDSVVSVGGDAGLQYAKVTGDWNPHHIYSWTANLLGYRSPIAHGMWTMARSLHEVLHSDKIPKRYPINVDCAFKRPLFMPGDARIQFGHEVTTSDEKEETFWFKCSELNSGAPHVVGTVKV